MTNFIISLLLGALPDSLYITLFITKTKGVSKHKLILFATVFIGYILFLMICRYSFMLYFIYIIHIYLMLKLLYKSKIQDIFIIITSYVYLILSGVIGSLFIGITDYAVGLVINKVVLFTVFIFSNKLNKVYKQYLMNWNVKPNSKIKSITLRNISLVTMNIMLVILDVCLVFTTLYYFNH